MGWTKFFVNQIAKNIFSRFFKKGEQSTDSVVAFDKTKRDFFKLATRFNESRVGYFFHSANLLTLKFKHCVREESFIAIIYRR